MSQEAANYLVDPQVALEELRDSGAVSPEVFERLNQLLIQSQAGRNFGHPSAVELPKRIVQLARKYAERQQVANEDESARVRSIFDLKVGTHRERRLTPLNNLLREIANEIDGREVTPAVNKPLTVSLGKPTLTAKFISFLLR